MKDICLNHAKEREKMTGYTFESYTITTQPVLSICKQPALWGAGIRKKGSDENYATIAPLIYFQKPKWMSQKSFLELVKTVRIAWPITSTITVGEEGED